MRIEELTDEATVLHALSNDDQATNLCGTDASAMDGYMVPDHTGAPHHELLFEDSNPLNHCKKCRTASELRSADPPRPRYVGQSRPTRSHTPAVVTRLAWPQQVLGKIYVPDASIWAIRLP